jgi:hypothetical protein
MTPYDFINALILSLVGAGGLAMLVSGWISNKITHLTDLKMQIQTYVVAVLITMIFSLLHWIPVSIGDVWAWVGDGIVGGLASNFLYKSEIFWNLMAKVKALTPHQLAQ